MKSILAWVDKCQDKEQNRNDQCIYDLAFKPDGTELLVASGARVLVYDGNDGTLTQTLRGHKDTVYCIDYALNGERFATGSADKSVIIWTEQHEGILKYNHSDAMQCLAFSPSSAALVSCAVTDFGLWAADQKSVSKHKVPSRICSCAWSRDGQTFAVGLYSGTILLRHKNGEEKNRIDRPNGAPIWAMKFSTGKQFELNESSLTPGDVNETIAVADWSPSLCFYGSDGTQLGKDCTLQYDPCALDYFSLGEYLVMGGSNCELTLMTRDGIRLGTVCEQDSWVWCCRAKPQSQFVVVGCQDGTVACYQLVFSTVHGLHKERYAYRDSMTDVIVQHLLTDKKVRIKCKDLVKKVAIYRNKLAIQMSDRIIIYELATDNDTDMNYKARDRILQNLECSLLEKRLQSLDFRGLREREWCMEALIRYIKVIGGPPGRESMLVGLKNGEVLKIFIDNPFPVQLLKIKNAVRCLDLSMQRSKLAVVDENSTCLVYDLKTKELLFQEPNANSVAWNTTNEDLLCFSGNGILNIKAQHFPVYQQRLQRKVYGFSLYREGYRIACLGVTEADWELLALDALEHMDFQIAKKAFIRTRNLKFLELIHNINERKKKGDNNEVLFLADVLAYEEKLNEAAQLFKQAGFQERAMDMYTDLRMFDKAQELLTSSSGDIQKALIRKRADWAQNSNEPRIAAEMYIAAADYDRAITIIGEHGWTDMLTELARKLDRSSVESLKLCAHYFVQKKEYEYAAEVYRKIGDVRALALMHVNAHQWQEAFSLAEENPKLRDDIYLPYANWLAESDRFEEAQKAFHKAGRQAEALLVLEQLTQNAVSESRFNDAGYYYWMLSMQCLERAGEDADYEAEHLSKFRMYQKLAEIYYAYHTVHRYTDEPFTSYQADALFNISKFLFHAFSTEPLPSGVSKVATLYTLGKQSKALGAYKLARHVFEKLQKLRAPARFQSVIDYGSLTIRAKPFHDADDYLPICYRCQTTNPLLNPCGNACVQCKQPYVFSFVSFEVLPVVEFTLEDGISDTEALDLISAEPPLEETTVKKDPFNERIPNEREKHQPVVVNRAMLLSLNRTEVVICDWPKPLKNQYFRNIIPDISITRCQSCNRLFHTDDYEMQVLQEGHCPFCHRESHIVKQNFDED